MPCSSACHIAVATGAIEADEATLEAAEHLLAIARAASVYILPPPSRRAPSWPERSTVPG